MNTKHLTPIAAVALVAVLALTGCKKQEEAAAPPPVVMTPPQPAPVPVAATVAVSGVELGNAVGADMKVTASSASFRPKDTIIAAVSTLTSDSATTVAGKLSATWTYQDGQVVNAESKNLDFVGSGVTDFQIAKPDGWPAGKYKVEISLNGSVVQSKDFEVK